MAATGYDNDVDRRYNKDIFEELKVILNEQNSMLEKQSEKITELTKQVQEQHRQLDKLMHQNNELREGQESKGVLERLFKGN